MFSVVSTIGARIKAVRLRAKLPQHRFATALGYSTRAIINWEQDAAEPPIAILTKLRQQFDVDPEWVVMGEDDVPRSHYGRTDWERYERIRRDVDLVCMQVGADHDEQTRIELTRDLFDEGPEAEQENMRQLRKFLRPSLKKVLNR